MPNMLGLFAWMLLSIFGVQLASAAEVPDPIPGGMRTFVARYTCSSPNGVGCSAACASVSFSPVTQLTIILFAIDKAGSTADLLYYQAQLPKANVGKANAGNPKFAEGFVLNASNPCGTVNMHLEFTEAPKNPTHDGH
jgi:hypothetical protein